MAKKRRSSQFKDTSQVIDIEEARRKRQAKRQKQQQRIQQQEALNEKRPVRASIKAGRRKKSFIYAVVIICIIAAIGASLLHIIKLNSEYKEIEQQNQELQQQKEQLEKQLKNSKDDSFIEEEARQQLRMVNPGEYVYIVPFGNESAPAKNTESEE